MRSYGQYCPISKGAELLGDRWTLLIIREMLFGPLRFTEIEQGLPGISRSVLASRLRRLQRDGVIERTEEGGGYRFTPAGESLRPVVQAIGDWVATWVMQDPQPAELDPELLMLFISRHVRHEKLPPGKTVVAFNFADDRRRFWLTMERHDSSVCLEDPCLPVAVTIRGSVRELYRVYMGRTTLSAAIDGGTIELDGLPADRRRFAEWMRWSHFSPTVSAAQTSRH
ncbi:MAG: winged helix-turn-helix transcriptional regulator [Actinomycetota bacterium]|nr:winged helix-turn-helix transcriptional regulator [Actinomycetota bacterium]